MTLESFEELCRSRRTVRNFRPDDVPEPLLRRLLECGRWAPSGYNLQPTHIIVVRDAARRRDLRAACLGQRQVEEAPVVLVLVGDRRVVDRNFERVLKADRDAGAVSEKYESMLREIVPMSFSSGPLGLGRVLKSVVVSVRRWFTPTPELPAQDVRFWLAKQAMLPAMNIMLAAHAAGLATVPMEGFDEARVKRVLSIPGHCDVVLVMPVGFAADPPAPKTRLPLDTMLHADRW
jgi:nitroreductase